MKNLLYSTVLRGGRVPSVRVRPRSVRPFNSVTWHCTLVSTIRTSFPFWWAWDFRQTRFSSRYNFYEMTWDCHDRHVIIRRLLGKREIVFIGRIFYNTSPKDKENFDIVGGSLHETQKTIRQGPSWFRGLSILPSVRGVGNRGPFVRKGSRRFPS